jgi:intraflagellar transport protein 88
LVEVLKNDKLRKFEKERKLYAERCVLSAARLIAPAIEASLSEGYHWVTEEIKASKHSQLAHALEVMKDYLPVSF